MTVPAYPGRTFPAKLLSVGAMVDPTTRTVPLLAETDNTDGLLKLEMFTRIVLDSPSRPERPHNPGRGHRRDRRAGRGLPPYRPEHADLHLSVGQARPRLRTNAGSFLPASIPGQTVVSAGAYLLKSELILQNEGERIEGGSILESNTG